MNFPRSSVNHPLDTRTGNSGAGKTFTGDCLATQCNFHHVEGDAAAFSTDPADKALLQEFVKAFDYWFQGKPAPPNLWHAYLERQCTAVHAAHSIGISDVVVSLTVYHREARDFISGHLPDHYFIVLQCDPDELVRRACIYARVCNQTFEECYTSSTRNHTPMLPLTPRHAV